MHCTVSHSVIMLCHVLWPAQHIILPMYLPYCLTFPSLTWYSVSVLGFIAFICLLYFLPLLLLQLFLRFFLLLMSLTILSRTTQGWWIPFSWMRLLFSLLQGQCCCDSFFFFKKKTEVFHYLECTHYQHDGSLWHCWCRLLSPD